MFHRYRLQLHDGFEKSIHRGEFFSLSLSDCVKAPLRHQQRRQMKYAISGEANCREQLYLATVKSLQAVSQLDSEYLAFAHTAFYRRARITTKLVCRNARVGIVVRKTCFKTLYTV